MGKPQLNAVSPAKDVEVETPGTPGVQALTKQTIPEVGQLVRDLRATTESLRSVTERLDREGALSIMRGQKLPDYEPSK